MPRKPKTAPESAPTSTDAAVTAYKHQAKRKNLPGSGLAAPNKAEERPKIRHEYNPHLPPVLRFDTTGQSDRLPALLAKLERGEKASADEIALLANALGKHEPWLEWSGKREKPWFEVDPVALHMHERVSTQAILRVLAREDVQRSLFADPQRDYDEAVQAYKHDMDWANRMILGDSLQVMASLARREDLAGKVQMIYFDPPYGIKFGSNFQPQLGQRDVKDRDQDLTREPEMVRAYRDTWTLGVHSYLAYLRDRLTMMRELLADTGSIFVQISDENLHRVRMVLDEVFGAANFASLISFKTTQSAGASTLDTSCDYVVWYAKEITAVRWQPLFKILRRGEKGATRYSFVEDLDTGETRRIDDEEAEADSIPQNLRLFTDQGLTSRGEGAETTMGRLAFEGDTFTPTVGHWRSRNDSVQNRLIPAGRVMRAGSTLRFKKFFDDFGCLEITNLWDDVGGGISSRDDPKIYAVQTSSTIIQRCMLMTTDPGDLVLDPTCGSGTTAYVAEQWGRRWITIDTSRVALALARQRLMTAKYPLYKLRPLNPEDIQRNPRGAWLRNGTEEPKTFACKTVPHITLKSIARNTALDPIFARHEPILQAKLDALNAALKAVPAEARQALARKLYDKQRREGKKAISDADRRRWVLPPKNRERKYDTVANDFEGWYAWEVPFDTDPDWPEALQAALTDYRAAWRAKMDEVNAAISANADNEELVDQPFEERRIVRVAGPFSMESVIALEEGPDTPIGGAPEPDEATFDGTVAAVNADAHLDKIIRLLRASGVDFKNNVRVPFVALEPVAGVDFLHAQGTWMPDGKTERRVAVSIGPEVGNLSRLQAKAAFKAANRRGFDDLIFAANGFDGTAQDEITEDSGEDLRLHMSLIRPDVGMDDLLKTQPGSQIFTVFTAPRVSQTRNADGDIIVTMEGMDVYDPVSNTLQPTPANGLGAWFVDGDYDGRTFCITQAFFPDKSKWEKLAKALGTTGVIDESAFDALSGTSSLPIPRPGAKKKTETWRIAVKVIDPRGNEGMRVLTIENG
ncbi:MAG: site-specific DNA-methyltransferase [Thermoflexales bacterium]|nr:site-specific DNA-methyltransferase [Thermoflexales bacterium]